MNDFGPALNLNTYPYQCNHATRSPKATLDTPDVPLLPMWLTQEETDALIQLCGCSTAYVGETERTLLPKLGDLYRAFQR